MPQASAWVRGVEPPWNASSTAPAAAPGAGHDGETAGLARSGSMPAQRSYLCAARLAVSTHTAQQGGEHTWPGRDAHARHPGRRGSTGRRLPGPRGGHIAADDQVLLTACGVRIALCWPCKATYDSPMCPWACLTPSHLGVDCASKARLMVAVPGGSRCSGGVAPRASVGGLECGPAQVLPRQQNTLNRLLNHNI